MISFTISALKFKTDPLAINMDITDPVQIKKMKNTVLKKYKKIYGLINNANPYVTQHDLKFQNFPLNSEETQFHPTKNPTPAEIYLN